MGFFKVEKFDDIAEWQVTGGHTYYSLGETDWPHLISSPDKSAALRLTFDKDQAFTGESSFYKDFPEPVYFVTQDYFNKPVHYSSLMLTILAHNGASFLRRFPQNPSQFYLSMSLWDGDQKMREWYTLLEPGQVQFSGQCFDLTPLIEQGYTRFTRIQFNILQHGNDLKVYFGDAYLAQDEVEHNLAVSIQKQLHLKVRRKLTTLAQPAFAGDKRVSLTDIVDIYGNTPLLIGDPDGIHELHVVDDGSFEDPEAGGDATIGFTGEFDTEALQGDWAAGTDVWYAVPATIGDLSRSDAIFPVFYIAWGAPTPTAEWTPDYGRQLDSYVRDPINGDTVGTRLSPDTTRMDVQVHVYAPNLELATEMWRFLRSIYDEQNFIDVAGISVDYDVTDYRKMNPGEDVIDSMPHYIMELDCFPTENVHTRVYRPFPALKLLTEIESSPIE